MSGKNAINLLLVKIKKKGKMRTKEKKDTGNPISMKREDFLHDALALHEYFSHLNNPLLSKCFKEQ